MKRIVIISCILLGIACANETGLQALEKGNQEFTSSLYKQTIKDKGSDNVISSPISAQIILALTTLGAKDDTFDEMAQTLRLPNKPDEIKSEFKALSPKLKSNEAYTLNSANKVYLAEGFTINKDFQQIAVNDFNAGVENVNFNKKAEAANKINSWVESQTNNKIKDLISPDILDESTRVILVNALHFKGSWVNSFEKYLTTDAEFFKSSKETVKVPTMQTTDYFKYKECGFYKAKFIELPYMGGDISMTIVLPNDKDGLSKLEENSNDLFKPHNFTRERVLVKLPKFKITSDLNLKNILKELGMKKVFDPTKADLSGISLKKGDLYVSDVIQKAFIEVNEDGTEAAAATAVKIATFSAPLMPPAPPKEFKADHPFIFYLRQGGTVLFSGRVTHP